MQNYSKCTVKTSICPNNALPPTPTSPSQFAVKCEKHVIAMQRLQIERRVRADLGGSDWRDLTDSGGHGFTKRKRSSDVPTAPL